MLYKNIIASSQPLVVSVPTCSMEEGAWSCRSEWALFSAHHLKVPSWLEGSCDLWPGSGRLGNSCSVLGHCEISVTRTDSSYVKRATVSSFKDTSRRRKGFFPLFFFPILFLNYSFWQIRISSLLIHSAKLLPRLRSK